MKQLEFKETNVAHCTGKLKMKVYNVNGVYCHWHEEYEFLIVKSEVCECIVDTVRYSLKRGECLIVFPGELHAVIGDNSQVFAVVFHPSVVCGDELKSLLSPAVSFRRVYSEKNEDDRQLLSALNELCSVSMTAKKGYELLMKAYITLAIGKLYEKEEYVINDGIVEKNNVFASVLGYVEEHYSDPSLTLGTVSRATNFSRSYVSRLFRENTGSSFCEYLSALRLSKAAHLLNESDLSVLDIALLCGFQHVSYFIQVFKGRYGSTPHKYRTK